MNGDDENPYDEFTPNGPEDSEEITPDHTLPPEGESGASMWDDPSVVESLKMEREVHPTETSEEMAQRFLREAIPNVTQGMIKLALSASNENTKLNAQKFIMQMVLQEGEATKASWEDFVADAVSDVELHANTGSGGSS